ncbi:MAG: site-2 protease family protein [Gemmatimonadetes bacterium]|nr:site-2 protease family protein [Gemmatimonadota bacterium]
MDVLILIPVLLFSFVVHEVAHAWVADRQGDPTAREQGRITLNPIPHIDLLGTIVVPALLIGSGSGILIGWAKPVPVVPSNFRNERVGDVLVSVAGVAANFALALLCTGALILLVHLSRAFAAVANVSGFLEDILTAGIALNFLLAVFNLLPIPPLDGSRLLYRALPARAGRAYARLERFGVLVFILLLMTGAVSWILWPAGALERLSWAIIEWST